MQNFFTPVEVVRKHPLCYSSEELLRFNQSLFQITQPRVPSLADERKKVIHWLRSIPLSHRQQAATIHSPQFAALCRRLHQEGESVVEPLRYGFQIDDGQFRVLRERFYKQTRDLQRVFTSEALIKELRLVSQGQLFEAVTLAESALAQPQTLFERFELILGGVLLEGGNFSQEELKSGRICFEGEAIDSESKTLGVWVAELMIKQILLSFTSGSAKIEEACKHAKQQDLEYSKLWRELTAADRKDLVQKGFRKPYRELMEDYRCSVGVVVQQLPKLYTSSPIQEVQDAINEYVSMNGKDLFSRLALSTLEQSLTLNEMFKIELIMEIEAYLAGNKPDSQKKQKKKKKKKAEKIDSIPVTIAPLIKNDDTNSRGPAVQNSINHLQQKIESLLTLESPIYKNEHRQAQLEPHIAQNQNLSQTMPKILPPQQPKSVPSILDDFARRIKQKNRDKYRKIILNRITFILSQLNLACRPFGSYAFHLSLPDSDLDIQVDSSLLGYFYLDYLSQRKQVVAALDFLKKVLEPQTWVSGFQLFYNAKIPLLTFKADAGVHFVNPTNIKTKLKLNGKAVANGETAIQVDLSIQPYANMTELPHNGLQATQLIREWMDQTPVLEKLVLGLKGVIRKANLHKSYEGGLSSYCLVLLSVAFLKQNHAQKCEQQSNDTLFEALLDFIRKFHKERLTIDISGEQIVREGKGQAPVLISPWDGRNLVERAFRFEEVLAALDNWKEALQK